jgi:hypothetical protein
MTISTFGFHFSLPVGLFLQKNSGIELENRHCGHRAGPDEF